MELYLRWLQKNEMQKNEETPIGLILCAEGNKEQIELLQLNKAGIKVAEYLTELPDKKLLQQIYFFGLVFFIAFLAGSFA